MKTDNTLSQQGILSYLPKSEKEKMSKCLYIYDCLESTNSTAKEMALSGAEHGTVVIADSQTAGKGTRGKTFFSPPNHGLYMSFILRPEQKQIYPDTAKQITTSAAAAVCRAIESITDKTPKVKRINDIFLADKKICGILTESVNSLENKAQIILGIGINITDPPSGFPPEIQSTAGSLFGTTKPTITRNCLTAELINRILFTDDLYDEKMMLSKYKERMFMLGKTITFNETENSYEATALDVDDIGRLVVKTFDNNLMHLSTGEVSIKTLTNEGCVK